MAVRAQARFLPGLGLRLSLRPSPQGLLWSGLTLVLVVLVLLPVYHLVRESFYTSAGFSLANYAQITQ